MTDDELKEKVIEKLDLKKVPDSLEWINLEILMREKAERLGFNPGFYGVANEPDEKVYYHIKTCKGRVLSALIVLLATILAYVLVAYPGAAETGATSQHPLVPQKDNRTGLETTLWRFDDDRGKTTASSHWFARQFECEGFIELARKSRRKITGCFPTDLTLYRLKEKPPYGPARPDDAIVFWHYKIEGPMFEDGMMRVPFSRDFFSKDACTEKRNDGDHPQKYTLGPCKPHLKYIFGIIGGTLGRPQM